MTLHGRFYFKLTDSGNLIGEFSNDHGPDVMTESADFIAGGGNRGFAGSYHATWQEKGEPCYATLEIKPKTGSPRLFTLNWRDGEKQMFQGEGMLCDGVLIGDYHD